jgi:hypothetical protein
LSKSNSGDCGDGGSGNLSNNHEDNGKRHIDRTPRRDHKPEKSENVNYENNMQGVIKEREDIIEYISLYGNRFEIFTAEFIKIMERNISSINDDKPNILAFQRQHNDKLNNLKKSLEEIKITFDDNTMSLQVLNPLPTSREYTEKVLEKNKEVISKLLSHDNAKVREAAQDSLRTVDKLFCKITETKSLDIKELQDSLPVRRALTKILKSISNDSGTSQQHQSTSEEPYSYETIIKELSVYELKHFRIINDQMVDAITKAENDDAENLHKWHNHVKNIFYSKLLKLEDIDTSKLGEIPEQLGRDPKNMNSRAIIHDGMLSSLKEIFPISFKEKEKKGKPTDTKLYSLDAVPAACRPEIEITNPHFPNQTPFSPKSNLGLWEKLSRKLEKAYIEEYMAEIPKEFRKEELKRTGLDAEVKVIFDIIYKLKAEEDELNETKLKNLCIDLIQTKGSCTGCDARIHAAAKELTKILVIPGHVETFTLNVYYDESPCYKTIDLNKGGLYTTKYGNNPISIQISEDRTIYLQQYTLSSSELHALRFTGNVIQAVSQRSGADSSVNQLPKSPKDCFKLFLDTMRNFKQEDIEKTKKIVYPELLSLNKKGRGKLRDTLIDYLSLSKEEIKKLQKEDRRDLIQYNTIKTRIMIGNFIN